MKSLLKYVAAIVLCAGLMAPDALAIEAVPNRISIQGVLRNVAGDVVNGTYSMKFSLYDAATGGNVLCQQISNVAATGGVFNAGVTCLATAFINKSAVWLGIAVGADAELERVALSSVGFAIQAEHAEQADELIGPARDLDCNGCVGDTEVSFNYAASTSKAGPAINLVCDGCVAGGTSATGSDIAAGTITSDNIGALQVATGNIANSAVTNAKLAGDAVKTGNIEDLQVTTNDLATGAVTAAKLGNNSVGYDAIGVNYALGDAKAGNATGLNCNASPCVSSAEVQFNYAGSSGKGGDASGLNCLASPCVEEGEVTFKYAASGTKGGAASDVACVNCVDQNEVQFNYAGSLTEGGAASDLACTNCVVDTEVAFNYAGSTGKGGAASDVACAGTCIGSAEVDFNYAGSAGKGGAANDLICATCVQTTDLDTGSVTNVKVATGIDGSKITTATTTALGVVKIGSGISITNGSITPDYNLVSPLVHSHSGYFTNGVDNLEVGDGKYISFLDPGDNPGSYAAKLSEGTASGGSDASLKLTLGVASATPAKSYFEIVAEGGLTGQKHRFEAGGKAYHAGDLQIDGALSCGVSGCVDSADIVTGGVTGTDILDGTVTGLDLDPALALTTTNKITANEMWAKKFVDSDGSAWYVDPASTSYVNELDFVNVKYKDNTAYGLMAATGSKLALYTSTIDSGAIGDTLYIQKNTCAQIDVWGGSTCANNLMTVHGTVKASLFYDADGAYYVDPSAHSLIKTFKTDTVELPRTGTTTNYITGTTYAFDQPWLETTGAWQLDPSGDSKFNILYANGIRLNTSWPGDPANGSAQVANDSHNLVLSTDSIGGGTKIYMKQGGSKRISFDLTGTVEVSQPSFRTDGGYLVINASGVSDKRLLLNWDVPSGVTQVVGTFKANSMVDVQGETCIMDPADTTGTGGGTGANGAGGNRAYSSFSVKLSAYDAWLISGLRVDGTGIRIVGNGDWGTGLRMYGNTTVIPETDGAGAVGMSERRFAFMYSVNSVWTSERSAKKDIRYLNSGDMDYIGNAIQQIKPATWLYNQETAAESADKGTDEMFIRNVPHIGAILDEMPSIITNGGQGWYANDSVGFLLVASKYLDDKINKQAGQIRDLEDRLALLEQAIVDAGLYN